MANDSTIRPDIYRTAIPSAQAIDAIASYCGRGERKGRDWKCNCPICGKHSLSVSHGRTAPLLIKCWYCEACDLNDGYTKQREWLIDAGLLPEDFRSIKKLSAKEYREWLKGNRDAAARLWERQLSPIKPESIAAKYLKARGLESFISHPALRTYNEGMFRYSPGRYRSVLGARVWHVEHGLCAVQLTYLDFDGSDRDRELEPGRKTFGPRKGGAVWIGAPKPDEEVVVGEGLENVLSAMLLLKLRCGAAVLGPDFKNLVLPRAAKCIRIAADNDDTGRGASDCARKLWCRRGIKVRVSMPDKEGEDFNDVLLKGGSWS
jgi:hypothetical protein